MITEVEPNDLIMNEVEFMQDFGPKYTPWLGFGNAALQGWLGWPVCGARGLEG